GPVLRARRWIEVRDPRLADLELADGRVRHVVLVHTRADGERGLAGRVDELTRSHRAVVEVLGDGHRVADRVVAEDEAVRRRRGLDALRHRGQPRRADREAERLTDQRAAVRPEDLADLDLGTVALVD